MTPDCVGSNSSVPPVQYQEQRFQGDETSHRDIAFPSNKADKRSPDRTRRRLGTLSYLTGDERRLCNRSLQMILRFQCQHFFFPELIDGA